MNPLLTGIQQRQGNNNTPSVQEIFQKMMSGQINPKEFMTEKINSLSPQEKTRFRIMLNNGVFRQIFGSFGISDSQYMDFVKSINI